MTTIQPTVGRKVWYRLGHNDDSMQVNRVDGKVQPLDATIVAVHSDSCVNLVVFDALGHFYRRTSVMLLQGEDNTKKNDYCHWMPYQVGQAKEHEPQRPDAPQIIKPQSTPTKITPERITELMARVKFTTTIEGTSTFVHAFLDGSFYLATGHSACVDPANFNEKQGYDIARKNASLKAADKLWELEGYALWKQLQAEPKQESWRHLFTTHQLETMVADAKSKGFEKIVIDSIVYVVADLKSELKRRGM